MKRMSIGTERCFSRTGCVSVGCLCSPRTVRPTLRRKEGRSMQKTTTIVLGLALMCTVLLVCAEGQEQQMKASPDVIDLTGRLDVTPDEVARGLGLTGARAFLPVSQVALPVPGKIAITIPFDFNSARIRPDAEPNLRSVGQALQHSSDRIRIEGHTDGIGKAQANL